MCWTGVQPKSYALATLHRPSNVDDPERLRGLTRLLTHLAVSLPVVFPIHPRTQSRMETAGVPDRGLILTPPLGYLDFLRLMTGARLVPADSGGTQEETTILNVPCHALRDNTERPVTIELGANRLVGSDPDLALAAALEVLDRRLT
jgi:UDP-N-acetylglucosamine 2-epimerase (non-hydrolysing)